MRAHVRVVTRTGMWIVRLLENGRKFMCSEYGWFRMNGYEDMNDNVNSQNGAWMTSWLSDDTEKLIGSIRNQNKDTVKIWNHSDRNFWDNRLTKLIRNKGKINK